MFKLPALGYSFAVSRLKTFVKVGKHIGENALCNSQKNIGTLSMMHFRCMFISDVKIPKILILVPKIV